MPSPMPLLRVGAAHVPTASSIRSQLLGFERTTAAIVLKPERQAGAFWGSLKEMRNQGRRRV